MKSPCIGSPAGRSVGQQPLPKLVTYLADIDLDSLERHGIQGIILDLDNTIVSEDDRLISPGAIPWIARAQQRGLSLILLSNGSRRDRLQRWARDLDLKGLSKARKPLPFGFCWALRQLALKPWQVVVVGDSLHTDILGARLIGCPAIQVVSLPHPSHWWEQWVQVKVGSRKSEVGSRR